jgi:type I restriction enzyme S subunit
MGDPPGDCAIYPLGSPEAVITADCLKFRLFVDYCARGFYGAFINSMVCRKQFGFITRGVAQKKISVERFKSIALPLCSLPEQQEIVRLLDEQFEVIERNEREIDAALRRSEALRQAILKKAFTGQLVAQDPADEPASVLLARLQAGRQESVAIKSQSVKKARTRRTTPG